jgi:hypothetical protein
MKPEDRTRGYTVLGLLLAATAALPWAVVLALGFWLEDHPAAPPGLAICHFVLALVVLPFTIGAAVAWRRHARAHRGGPSASASAAVLAEWAWLVVAAVGSLVTDFEKQIFYLRTEWMEVLLVLGIFGFAGAIMGAAGGAVAARVRRTRPAPDATPRSLGAAP